MSDDKNNGGSGGGFDDWLDDEPGPVTDPYKALASEDPEEEIAEWMEFVDKPVTEGQQPDVEEPDAEDTEDVIDETAEIEPVSVGDNDTPDVDTAAEDHDDTGELDALDMDSSSEPMTHDVTEELSEVKGQEPDSEDETVEVEVVAEDHHDTGELDILEADDGSQLAAHDVAEPDGGDDAIDDTDELEPVASVGFGDLWDDDASTEDASSEASAEPFDLLRDDYFQTATKEHEGLAESIALADDEDTEQVALAAPIPGLESSVVGFDDVVEAEGHGRVRARASGDLIARVTTGVVLIAALGASLLWRPALVVLALAVFVLGAGEFYTALVRTGRKPIALFGFIGVIGASLGAFFSGALWIPLGFLIAVTLLLLFYAVVPGKPDPMANLALTITVMVWAGLGSYAMLIAKSDSYRTLVFGVVVAVAAMDIAQYFFGRALGRHQLAPWVSPKKTVEGLIAGVIVAFTVGALLHFLKPFELTSGLAIGAAVAVFAPMGDLAMSAAKRSLGLKDMGSVLPGHGGFMDRIDGLLFVIPVAWAIFAWAGIL